LGNPARKLRNVAICTALLMCLATLTARNRKLVFPGAGLIIRRSPIQHSDILTEDATAIGQKRGYVSGVESVVDLVPTSYQNKNLTIIGRSGRI
jgi:hypothetical protein